MGEPGSLGDKGVLNKRAGHAIGDGGVTWYIGRLAGQTRNPKPETRMKPQTQSPKLAPFRGFWVSGFGHSFGFLVSGFGFTLPVGWLASERIDRWNRSLGAAFLWCLD